jgi:hypothetical protein
MTGAMRRPPPTGRTSNPAAAALGNRTGTLEYKDPTGDTASANVDRDRASREARGRCGKCHATATARVHGRHVLDWGLPTSSRHRHVGCGGRVRVFDTNTGRLA